MTCFSNICISASYDFEIKQILIKTKCTKKKKCALISFYIIFCNEVLELFADIPNNRAACYSNLRITEVKNNGFYCVGVTLFLDQTRNGLR